MPNWGVIPSIRVRNMEEALDFYQARLGFKLSRGGPEEDNCSLDRGDAHIMLEVPAAYYSPGYNEAIHQRVGTPSAVAMYIEADDLDELYRKAEADGVKIADPLAGRLWGQSEFTVEDLEGNWLTFWRATSHPE